MISGYLGSSDTFDRAVADFAVVKPRGVRSCTM